MDSLSVQGVSFNAATLRQPTSKLLINERPLVIQPSLARALGTNPAIVLQQAHYLLTSLEGRVINGRKWFYFTIDEWVAHCQIFSRNTMIRILCILQKRGLLLVGNFNASPIDQTKWYSLDYEKIEALQPRQSNSRAADASKFKRESPKLGNSTTQVGQMQSPNVGGPIPKTSLTKTPESNTSVPDGSGNTDQRQEGNPQSQGEKSLPPVPPTPLKARDKVYYEYQSGWGGGEDRRALALLLRLTEKMGVIALKDVKAGEVIAKMVSLSKLSLRTTTNEVDAELEAFTEVRQRDPLYDWIATNIAGITPESAIADKDLDGWIGKLTAKVVNSEKALLGISREKPLNNEQRGIVARQMPGFLSWYAGAANGASVPQKDHLFAKWIVKWYAAGKPKDQPTNENNTARPSVLDGSAAPARGIGSYYDEFGNKLP